MVIKTEKRAKKKKKTTHMTMMVIPHSQGNPIKNYCLPMWLLKSFFVVSIICMLIVVSFIAGYFQLRYVAAENIELREVNQEQEIEIKELKNLAVVMQDKLEGLIELDQEVRAKVGLASPSEEEKSLRTIDSSRNQQRLELITMGLGVGGVGLGQIADQQGMLIPYKENEYLVAPGLESQDGESYERIMELPVGSEEVDTLEELKGQLAKMDELLTSQESAMTKLKSDVESQLAYQNALPDIWPVQGRITSSFGWRRNPYSPSRSEFHNGIDIAASYGTAIKAAGTGVVTFSGYKSGWGRVVIISHGYGFVSQYAHNSSLLVKTGDKVEKGQMIARLGSTGRSTGPHLHFGVAKNGQWINPYELLKK